MRDSNGGQSSDSAGTCPHCGTPVDEHRAVAQGAWRRAGCTCCGLQLVRHPGQGWEGIRG